MSGLETNPVEPDRAPAIMMTMAMAGKRRTLERRLLSQLTKALEPGKTLKMINRGEKMTLMTMLMKAVSMVTKTRMRAYRRVRVKPRVRNFEAIMLPVLPMMPFVRASIILARAVANDCLIVSVPGSAVRLRLGREP